MPPANPRPSQWKNKKEEEEFEIDEFFDQANISERGKKRTRQAGQKPHGTPRKPVLEGKIPLMIHADETRQIRAAVEWADEKVPNDSFRKPRRMKLADWLGERERFGRLSSHVASRYRNSPHDEQFPAPGILAKAGVPLSIGFRLGGWTAASKRGTTLSAPPMQSLTVCRGKKPWPPSQSNRQNSPEYPSVLALLKSGRSNFHRHHGGLARPSLLRQTHGHCREKNKPAKPAHPFIRKIP